MILIGYIFESVIIYIWYNFVVKKEVHAKVNESDRILRRTINLLIQHRVIIKNCIFLRVNYRQEKRKNIDIIQKCVKNLVLINGWIGCFFAMGPFIMSFFIKSKESVVNATVFIVLIASILIKQLKEHTQCYIEVLARYIKQVIIPLENCPKLIEVEDDEIVVIQWTTKKKIMMPLLIITGIAMFLLTIWGEHYLSQNKIANGIVTIIAVAFLVIDYIKNKLAKREKEKKKEIVFVSADYDTIRDEVENICGMLGIQNVKFNVIDENRTNAFSRMNEDGMWEVLVTSQFLTKLRVMLKEDKNNEKIDVLTIDEVKKIFLVTVVHELGHVFYKDPILEKGRILLSVFVNIGIWIVAMVLLTFSVKIPLFAVVSSMLLLVEWIFGWIICDSRYWGQIEEFKADRIVAKYVEGGIEPFVYFWANDEKIQKEGEFTQNILKENWLYKYYKRNIEIEKHPGWKYRRKLMEERKEWKWWEYFEHALVIRKWRRNGYGWNGVLKVTGI